MKKQKHIIIGIILILISATVYGIEVYFSLDTDGGAFGGLFFFHYIPAMVYFFMARYHSAHYWRFFQKENFTTDTLILVLFNISAYSLNRNLPVFNDSSDWLMIFLIIENGLLITYALMKESSKILQYGMCFFMVIALLFNVYQTLMVLPASPFGVIGFPFLGISLLLFIPIFYIICIVTILRTLPWTTSHRIASGAGLLFSIAVITTFCIKWHIAESTILKSKLVQDAPFTQEQGIPDWITIAQVIDNTPLTEKYLKTGLVYQEFVNYSKDGFSSIWRSSIDEKFVHDPLVSIASIFMRRNTLDENTKIRILNYLYDARHQTSDRFWSGENLKSKQVVTNVELFPEERLSFTEQVITIENSRVSRSRWRSQQEALYTFDLPEGGVVTSLSLWIDGQEAKAVLTSKSKAKNAYNTIVGRERRDPSVVYWMEGNKIRVRVFPCTPLEDRKFKIGITAPLALHEQELKYQSIGFKGPDYSKAISAIHVVTHNADIIQSSINLEENGMFYQWQGDYSRDWHITIDKSGIPNSSFSFLNEHFGVEETISHQRTYKPQTVYLDVSSSWTTQELETMSGLVEGMEAYGFTTFMKKKNSANSIIRMGNMNLPTFTLFPFHKINGDQAIIITKGGKATPNLSDLKDTQFKDDLFDRFKNQSEAPLVIDIGEKPSDYIKSLKEFGVIEHHLLSLNQLITCFQTNQFPKVNSDSNLTVIPQNGLSIRKLDTPIVSQSNASDHLMRLFYYQEVMNDIGNNYFTSDSNDYIEDQIVNKAATANIVTPLSSLIVLETQQDYDRFGIKRKTDSLGNASISNSGAVPEPHEWALIIVGIGLLFFLYWKSKKSIGAA